MDDGPLLYLIRHGQTVWNREGRLQGGKDSPLTERGIRQAERAAVALGEAPPESILSSPLGRARRTAAIVASALDIEVSEDGRLGELRFGEAEGLTMSEIDRRWPDFRASRERDKWQIRWPGGECYRDADARIAPLVSEKLEPHLRKSTAAPLAVVGHETMNMILVGRLLSLEPSVVIRLGQPNGVVYRLTGRLIDHAPLDDGALEWIPGMRQKRSDDILHPPP